MRREHRGDTGGSGVVRVHVDGHVGQLGAERADEDGGAARREQAGHVLDGDRVHAELVELPRVVEVVLEVVQAVAGRGHVAGVADGRLDEAARLAHRLDAKLHVLRREGEG